MKRNAKTTQLTFDDARRPEGWGGWRPNAGRRKGRSTVAHRTREKFSSREPLHITLSLLPSVPWLRRPELITPFRGQIALAQSADFRIVHFNVEDTHIHLIVECSDKDALGKRVGTMKSRLARRINRMFGRKGRVFRERYHSRALSSPREVRNALRYVLNNYRHHAAERGEYLEPNWIDPFSSAAWFDGWAEPIAVDCEWKRKLLALPAPTHPPTVWLLKTGWRQHGLLRFDEIPGIRQKRARKKRER